MSRDARGSRHDDPEVGRWSRPADHAEKIEVRDIIARRIAHGIVPPKEKCPTACLSSSHVIPPRKKCGRRIATPCPRVVGAGGSFMEPWFVALTSSIPVAAVSFVWTYRWREKVRARRAQPLEADS
jgi:hypothetical protein